MEQVEIKQNWKPLKGYEGLYDISDYGLIYSHPRKGTKGGYSYGYYDGYGYLLFDLQKEKSRKVHILVYKTFVGDIPYGYEIHHKNHNRQDNRLENLECITKEEHTLLHKGDRKKALCKAVIQYTKDEQFVAEYESSSEAARQTGVWQRNISACCLGKLKTAGGYVWKYKGEE